MPVGYLITVGLAAAGTLLALMPLRRSGRLGTISWFLSQVVNESPFVLLYWLLAVSLLAFLQGDLATPLGWVGLALAGLTTLGFATLLSRSLLARATVCRALDEGLGNGWRTSLKPDLAAPLRRRLPWIRILLAPLPLLAFHRDVERLANLAYGDAGRKNLLDVYRRRGTPTGGPILVYLHGGRFVTGLKSFESRPLLYRLAEQGCVCISANYRLKPTAVFPDYLVDVKKVIAWAREHAAELGADPTNVFVAGSSAGAHLAALAALTPNDPRFQNGFEDANTTVSGAVCLYGYYGPVDRKRQPLPSSPFDYLRADAPPLLVAHGDQDTYVPAERARALAQQLRTISTSPVVYAELPGAQHSFDLFHSIRFETLIDAVDLFTAWIRSQGPSASRPLPSAKSLGKSRAGSLASHGSIRPIDRIR